MDFDFLIGERHGWQDELPFGIKIADERHHIYVIGKTGCGKTTLLHNVLIQHIQAGYGVGLIDPHGDLAQDILAQIPKGRSRDVIYFNPADTDFPIAFNLLANVSPEERHLAASRIVGACKAIWSESWGPRMEYIFLNAVVALMECQNTSLLGVNRLLTEKNYRAWVVRQVKDPFIRAYWSEEFEALDPRTRQDAISPIQNKLGQFLLNPVIRNILGQVQCKVSIPHVMDNSQIFIANLAKGKIGHDKANLLGSLLVTQFQLAAMARSKQPEAERKDFILFVDEFQNFSTDSFADILSEARKFRLSLVLSHQYVDQLSLEVRKAVLGNVGTFISFRVGNSDAEALHLEFGETLVPSQFVNLGKFEILVRLLENGTSRDAFRGRTLEKLRKTNLSPEKLIRNSREKFAIPRKTIENKLKRWIDESGR